MSSCGDSNHSADYTGWRTYAGSKDGIRYSSNDQINTGNVAQLQVAWSFSSKDKDPGNRTQNQCNPIVVDGILYGTSPRLKVMALNAATGELKWLFDPAVVDTSSKNNPSVFFKVSRGVVYWQDEKGNDKRILYNAGSKMYAINAADGSHIKNFGNGGFIDMADNLDREKGTFNSYMTRCSIGGFINPCADNIQIVKNNSRRAGGHV